MFFCLSSTDLMTLVGTDLNFNMRLGVGEYADLYYIHLMKKNETNSFERIICECFIVFKIHLKLQHAPSFYRFYNIIKLVKNFTGKTPIHKSDV